MSICSRSAALVAVLLSLSSVAASAAAPVFEGPFVEVVEPKSSRPLSELVIPAGENAGEGFDEDEPRIPPDSLMDRIGWGAGEGPADPLRGRSVTPGTETPVASVSVAGIGSAVGCGGCAPPDPMLAAGPNHVVQVVNASALQIFNKTGGTIGGAVQIRTLWTSGNCSTSTAGDPTVTYDWLADRWVIAQFSTGNAICVAVSRTADPGGAYWLYEFATPSFPDYFKIGAWGDAYYVGANESSYSALALNRANMLIGAAATSIRFTGPANFLMPATLGGTVAPPAGAPGVFYTFLDSTFHGGANDRLEFYHFVANFTTPASSSFGLAQAVTVTPFTYTVCGFFTLSCVPQGGTTRKIDAVSEWPMWQLQYRNFGAGDERLVGSFTIDGGADVAAVRWFEVRRPTPTTYTLRQEGTIGTTTEHRFMTSTAMDQCGNIAVGYSSSSSSAFPSLRYATRLNTDPLGTMQAEATLIAGGGSQTGNSRWGDYSAVVLDPADQCSFWMTGEYYAASASSNWSTRVGKFTLPECSATCGGAGATLSINDVSVTEGNAGTTTATFTITRTNNTGAASVQVATSNGTATAGSDYVAIASQTVNFTAGGALTATVAVTVNGDTVLEPNETFNVNLSGATGATISDATGVGTIGNDDTAGLTINDVANAEGNAGTTPFTFTATLNNAVQGGFTVPFSTSNGTATQPGDYASASGTLTFAGNAGETQTFTVNVVGDTQVEPNETFNVALAPPSNAAVALTDANGVGTINNDDAATIAINNVVQPEGNTGTTPFTFTVTLTGSVAGGFTVPFSTADNTATQPGDYASASGTLTFTGTAGETRTITVNVVGDTTTETNETFVVNLGAPSNANVTATTGTGTGVISNDDGASLTVANFQLAEGNSTTTGFIFTVTLTGNVAGGFTVPYTTTDGTATQPGDYASSSGTLTFTGAAGEIRQAVVSVVGDTIVEANETFTLELGTPSNAGVTIADGSGLGTITNDDTATLAIGSVTLPEGNAGNTPFAFTVTLTGAVQGGVSVPWSTANGTATQPGDYASASGNAVFAGVTGETQTITVQVVGDTTPEANETFLVNLGTPTVAGVTASPAQGTGTITNDDFGTDVSVTIDDGVTQVPEGQSVSYTVVVNNPSAFVDVAAVVIAQTASTGLTISGWTCTGSGGATCPASGSGPIAETRALPRGGTLTYVATGNVALGAPATVASTVTATVQLPATDPTPANNTATDTDTVRPDGLFSNGYE